MSFELYSESLKDEEGKDYAVDGGNLFLFNFKPGSDQPLSEHFQQIDEKVVPFCHRAISKLGNTKTAKWMLTVMGQASATGMSDRNMVLARNRALMAAEYAVASFNDYWSRNEPDLLLPILVPNYHIVGDKYSRRDKVCVNGAPQLQMEARQGEFRSASFIFKAASPKSKGPVTGSIRKLLGAEFKLETTPIQTIKEVFEGFGTIAMKTMKEFGGEAGKLSQILAIIGPLLTVGGHLLSYAIPKKCLYGYEVRDKHRAAAVYKFSGQENSDFVDLGEVCSLFAKLDALQKLVNRLKTLSKAAEAVELADASLKMLQLKDALAKATVRATSGMFGQRAGDVMARLLDNYDALQNGAMIPVSDWGVFQFHKAATTNSIQNLSGEATREVSNMGYFSREYLNFGGIVPGSVTGYTAMADISTGFDPSINKFMGGGFGTGTMTIVTGGVVRG